MKYLLFAFAFTFLAASCTPPVTGCMDANSFNYNPDATEDDGSCIAMTGCLGWLPNSPQSGQIVHSFDDADYDVKFAEEVSIQSVFFEDIPAEVLILKEPGPHLKNAYAASDGHILFGYYMFHEMLDNYGELPIAGILSHEWGHRTQQEMYWQDYSQPAHRELEADAFSGFYLFLAKQWAWSRIDQYYEAVMSFGDYNYNTPGHHGTPAERLAAARLGVEVANQAAQQGYAFTYDELHQIFNDYIRSEIKPRSSIAAYPEIEFPKNVSKAQARALFPQKSK